jgi:hypothetical protein
MYKVVIEAEAQYELQDAAEWYDVRSRGLGGKFTNAFLSVIDYLETHPAAFAKIAGEYHQLTMKRFPYVVIYKIIGSEVRINSVFHTSRNPKNKFK